jgi:hypothetical protein
MPSPADDVEPDFHLLPKNLQALVRSVGFPDFPEMDEDEAAIYGRLRSGRCMTCDTPLREHANFIITVHGIVGGYCNGVCHSDMAILGYLQEQHGDLVQRIAFREGRFPPADTESSGEEIADDN